MALMGVLTAILGGFCALFIPVILLGQQVSPKNAPAQFYGAWAISKLDCRGWWTMAIFIVLFAISGGITYSRHDVNELYGLGYPAEQVALMQKFNFLGGQRMVWCMILGAIPMLGYLVYIRKFFPKDTRA